MRRTPRNRWYTPLVWGLYLNAALLAAVLLAVVSRGSGLGSVAMAASPPVAQPITGGNGLFLMPAQFAMNVWGCYVMDVGRETLVAYEYIPAQKQLRLVTARHFTHDRQLMNYNTTPAPDEVARLVQLQNQSVRGQPGDVSKDIAPPPDGPPTTGEAWNSPPTPNGVTPNGVTPNGATPNGATPNGATPNGATPNGATPNGPPQGGVNGSTPVETAPGGRPLDRPPQPGDADFVPKPSDINNPG